MQTIVITGATDGIGRALAAHYRQLGARLVLVGRRPLAELDGALFSAHTYCQADLRADDCAERIAAFLAANGIDRLNLLIHNAGVGYVGAVGDQPVDDIRDIVAVNVRAPIRITHALLAHVQRAQGRVVFVSSVVSALATPRYAVYGASKAALDGFARALRSEQGRQISVQVIYPGATRTAMHAKVGLPRAQVEKFPPADEVAPKIAAAISGERVSSTIGRRNALLRLAGKRFGRLVDRVQRARGAPPRGRGTSAPLHCVITGAADGIGRALALRYAAAGYAITGIDSDSARSAETAAELRAAGAAVTFIQADLRHDWAWVDDLPPVDVLIHNAGISAVGRFGTLDLAQQAAVIDVNLHAPLQITRRLLRGDKLTAGASLVFISSLSHFTGYPGAAAYAASKDGLAHYARSLAVALWPRQRVLTVFPGPTRTAHARRYSPDNRGEARRMPPEKLAARIFAAQQRGQPILLPSPGARLLALLGHWLPDVGDWLMRQALFRRLPPR